MPYLKEEKIKLLGICFSGWVIFCLVEIAFRFIGYATFPWYKGTLVLPIYLLLLFIYGVIGILAGVIINHVLQILSKWSFLKKLKTECLYMSACQTFLVSIYGGNYLYKNNVHNNPLYLICYFIICVSVFLILYALFKKKESTGDLLSIFISLSFIVDILLVGGVYIYEEFIGYQKANLSFSLPINICALVGTCFLVYICFNKLLPVLKNGILRTTIILKRKEGLFFLCLIMGVFLLFFFLKYSKITYMSQTTDRGNKPNIIIITMDTTRRDHLSCYGYNEQTTPNLEGLAKENLIFENAYSTSSWTLPAHASLFTGLYPSKHGAYVKEGLWGYKVLNEKNITLAEILSQHGYKTAGFIGGYFCSSFFGMSQGFDYYNENLINLFAEFGNFFVTGIYRSLFPVRDIFEKHGFAGKRIAPQINRSAFKWIKKNCQAPFFLFLNYFDPHHPYYPLDDSQLRHLSGVPVERGGYVEWEERLVNKILRRKHALTGKEKKYLLDRYDSEIKQMDSAIGELLKLLKELGMYDNCIIIITSDHGESFGEHGLMLHTPAVYEELVKVPLIVKYPKAHNKSGRVSAPISLVDIMPEVLTVIGMPIPQGVQGVPFSQRRQNVIVERYKDKSWKWTAYPFGERSICALYEGNYKYLWASDGKNELYNLSDDPQELNNLLEQMPGIASEMGKKLGQWVQSSDKDHPEDKSYKVSREVEEALKALGYLQ